MRLAILIPSHDGRVHLDFTLSLLRFTQVLESKGIAYNILHVTGNSLVIGARNTLISAALRERSYSHSLFLDTDLGFDSQHLLDMLNLSLARGLTCVGGAYAFKRIAGHKQLEDGTYRDILRPVFNALNDADTGEPLLAPDDDGFLECRNVGTGLLLLDMGLVRELATNAQTYTDMDGNEVTEVFKTGVVDGDYLHEDFMLSYRVRELGEKVYLFTNINSRHHGSYSYEWGRE